MSQNPQRNSAFSLSFDSIKDMPFSKYKPNFTFIFNGKEYQTSRFFADFLSPIIRQYHFIDETIDRFYIDTSISNDFSKIISLNTFEPTNLSKDEEDFFIDIFTQLGNIKELKKLIPNDDKDITIENVFNRIENKEKIFTKYQNKGNRKNPKINESIVFDINTEIEKELEFISNHFYEIDINKFSELNPQLFEIVLKSENLKLKDEDSLLKIINSLYSKDHHYSYLYSYVDFLFVSQSELEHFSDIFDMNDINKSIWLSILNRALKYQETNQKNNSKQTIVENEGIPLLYIKKDEFNGIFKYLTQKTGGNIHDNGTIQATSNSIFNSFHGPDKLLNFDCDSNYCPKFEQINNVWICFDFKDKKVKITKYSIKSAAGSPNNHQLKSWDLEVSNDGKTWTKIDEEKNCETLNGDRKVGTFDVKTNDYSRYVRIHQTDTSWGNGYIWFYYLELYGFLLE